MPKYFVPQPLEPNTSTTIEGETAHHLLTVLRLKPGATITLANNGNATDYTATVTETTRHSITLHITTAHPTNTELPHHITLYQCMPKLDKLELITQKTTELGIHHIVPVISSRAIIGKGNIDKIISRCNRIAESAAGQSMRNHIPTIAPLTPFAEAIQQAKNTHNIIAYESQTHPSLSLQDAYQPTHTSIWIGPEGGFSPEEIHQLTTQLNATPITLGPRILRTETAAITLTANIAMLMENKGAQT